MAVVPQNKGRPAISIYSTAETFSEHSLLEVHPITGRTHQIRLHLAFIGCPVVGDRVYGRKTPSLEVNRQFLHAARILIKIPGEHEPWTFEAPMPEDLEELLASLRMNPVSDTHE